MDFVLKRNLFLSVFDTEIILKTSFLDILYRKEWFLGQKIEVWNWVKNWHFRKGLVHWFFQKSNFCYRCFSQKLFQKRSFVDILDRKQSFLDQKIEVLKRAKKLTFPKGLVHVFCPNIEVLVIGVFYRNLEKTVFYIVEGK